MNDPMLEQCAGCVHAEFRQDPNGEYVYCNIQGAPDHCSEYTALADHAQLKCTLISYTQNPVDVIERAASVCYDSEPSKHGRLVTACYNSGHHSVFEHVSFTFEIAGISRAALAQLTRHRLASFSVRSQRYCDESKFKYVVPKGLNAAQALLYQYTMDAQSEMYHDFRKGGVPQEDARMVLPNACETKLVCTMNFRELMHFSNLRLCARAQWEIRALANEMKRCINEVCPGLAVYLRPSCEVHAPYCYCPESHGCGKYPTLKEVYCNE